MSDPWFTLEDQDMARSLTSLVESTIKDDSPRIGRYKQAISRYEMRARDNLSPFPYQTNQAVQLDPETELRLAFGRMIVRAAVAKIAGTQQPKVQILTSNASWSKRRKARKKDQVIEGLWSTRQEPFADIWELGVNAFREAAVCDIGSIKVSADADMGKVLHERILPEDLFFPQSECRYGAPQTVIHRYDASKSTLKAWYPEHKKAIEESPAGTLESMEGIWDRRDWTDDRLVLYEVWRAPDGPDAPGRHVLLVQGSRLVLIDEDWDREPPFVYVHWDRAMRGVFGTSLMDETSGFELAINELWTRILDTVRRCSLNTMLVPEGTEITTPEDQVDAQIVTYLGAQAPDLQAPVPVSPAVLDLMRELERVGYDASGMNRMSATAQKQPGVTANSAILTLTDLQSEIFSVAWRAYQQLFVDLARQDLHALRDLVEDDPDFEVGWKGEGFLRNLKPSELDLDDVFEVALQPAPSTKGTAADRLQSAENLFAAGLLTQDALLAIRTHFDTPGEVERASRQRQLVDRMIERWLDATPEELASGKLTETGQPLIPAPIRWMKLEDAIAQVADGYLAAELDDAPDAVKNLFLVWLEQADMALQQKNAELQALQAAAQAQQAPAPQPPTQAAA